MVLDGMDVCQQVTSFDSAEDDGAPLQGDPANYVVGRRHLAVFLDHLISFLDHDWAPYLDRGIV